MISFAISCMELLAWRRSRMSFALMIFAIFRLLELEFKKSSTAVSKSGIMFSFARKNNFPCGSTTYIKRTGR